MLAQELLSRPDVNPRLSNYLASLAEADLSDHRTPFWGKGDRQPILESWLNVLESNKSRLPGRLMEYELEELANVGPVSPRHALSSRMPGVRAYFDNRPTSYPEGFEVYFERILPGEGKLRPLSFEFALAHMQQNTNSGYPHFTRTRLVVDEVLREAKAQADDLLAAILFTRSTSHGPKVEDTRNRTVWGYPKAWSLREMRYFFPLLDVVSSDATLSALRGTAAVDQAVFSLMEFARFRNVPIYSTDFSGYDTSLGGPLLSQFMVEVAKSYQASNRVEVEALDHALQNMPLLVAPDLAMEGLHGMPSGTTFTNLGDSVIHKAGQKYVARFADAVEAPMSQVQGDDGLLCFDRPVDEQRITDAWQSWHLDDNAEKRYVGYDDCQYLRRYYHRDWPAGGIYPTFRALNSLLGQERFYNEDEWGPDMVIIRAIMILENVKWHPLFAEFVRFVADGDIYRLGSAWPGGLRALLSRRRLAKANSIVGLVPAYNQEQNIRGIFGFQTAQLIQEGV